MSYIENLEKQLFEMQDLKYRDFHSKLLPGIDRETIIGHKYSSSSIDFQKALLLQQSFGAYSLFCC